MAQQAFALMKVPTIGQIGAKAQNPPRVAARFRTRRGAGRIEAERMAMARIAAHLNSLGDLHKASPAVHAHILETIKQIAGQVDVTRCRAGSAYGRRVLHEDESGWSLAAISLRPGQATESHDHGGWGCAVVVQGIERDRRFVDLGRGLLELVSEHTYAPGTGYSFDPSDIHQPVGADPNGLTVALHFLIHGREAATQHHAETKPHLHLVGTDDALLDEAA